MTSVRAPTAILCLSAVLATGLVWAWALRTHQIREERAAVPVRAETDVVPGHAGEFALADGTRFLVRIARLHDESERQRFDSNALARRFQLGEGEPFQCIVTLRAAPDLRAAIEPRSASATANATARAGIHLAGARIEDERGVALRALNAPESRTSLDLVDPLATLIAPPSEPLCSECSVSLLMWGREPSARAHFVVADLPDVEIAAVELPTRDLGHALARIDGDAPSTGASGSNGDRR